MERVCVFVFMYGQEKTRSEGYKSEKMEIMNLKT